MVHKICYIHEGNNIYDYRFLEHLVRRYKVYLLTFYKGRLMCPEGVEVRKLWDPPYPPSLVFVSTFLFGVWVLLRTLVLNLNVRRIKPNVVNAHWLTTYAFYCAIIKLFNRRLPLIVTVWGSDIFIDPTKCRIFKFMAKFSLRMADAVIVDSLAQKKACIELGCSSNKIYDFPWGVDLTRFNREVSGVEIRRRLGWESNYVVISVRNHEPVYNVECLIQAIPSVIKNEPKARFIIGGSGSLSGRLEKIVKELGVEEYVHFTGKIPYENMPTYLAAADIYVSTSLSDGSSASLMEAMACGLPVIVTDLPANHEWVVHGENGYLVPLCQPNSLSSRILLLLHDPILRVTFSRRNVGIARERADWLKNSAVFYKVIEEALRSKL